MFADDDRWTMTTERAGVPVFILDGDVGPGYWVLRHRRYPGRKVTHRVGSRSRSGLEGSHVPKHDPMVSVSGFGVTQASANR